MAGIAAGLILTVAGLNLAIDRSGLYPYAAWNTRHTILQKTAATKPEVFIVGSSRISVFQTEGEVWGDEPEPRMPFALSGAQFDEMVEGLERVGAIASAEHIIIGLDFFGFNVFREYDDLLYPVNVMKTLKLYFRYTVPVSTLYERVRLMAQTVIYQFRKLSAVAAGRTEEFLKEAVPPPSPEVKPYRGIFEDSSRLFIGNYLGNKYGAYSLGFPMTGYSPAFSALERLLAGAEANRTRVSLFVYPSHAWEYELIRRAGAWPSFGEWKKRLVEAVYSHAGARQPRPLFQLFDFSGYNCVTEERVPEFGRMRWHWDVAHFNQYTVGKAIVLRLLGREAKVSKNPIAPCPLEDFGSPLTPESVAGVNAEASDSRASYLESRPAEMAIIERLWSERRIRRMRRHLW